MNTQSSTLQETSATVFTQYSAPDDVRAAIARLGRTEDIKFSPNNHRLAIASMLRNVILVLDVDLDFNCTPAGVSFKNALEVECDDFKHPHGLCWVDDTHLVIGSRQGDVSIIAVPDANQVGCSFKVEPLQIMRAGGDWILNSPGSVTAHDLGNGFHEILVCNNYVHYVSRHIVDASRSFLPILEEVLLKRDLDIPDGVTLSDGGCWAAVSNHNEHCVNIYNLNAPELGQESLPDIVLEGISYPHGLRFSPQLDMIYVADAGAPFVRVFTGPTNASDTKVQPLVSIKVIEAECFAKGNRNEMEGGPKGLDITANGHVLALTCEEVPLVFVDLRPMRDQRFSQSCATSEQPRPSLDAKHYELLKVLSSARQEVHDKTAAHDAERAHIFESRSWRFSAPLRWFGRLLGR